MYAYEDFLKNQRFEERNPNFENPIHNFENNNAYLNIQCTKLKHECTIFKIKKVCLFLETNLANLENGLVVSIMCFVYFENVLFYLGI